MKTLKTLFVIASLFTVIAWISLQGVSNATIRTVTVVPVADERPVIRRQSAPIRATAPAKAENKPAPAKPKAPSPFQVALEAADLCEVSRILTTSYQTDDVYGAVVAVMSPSPALQEAFGPKGAMMALNDDKPKLTHVSSETIWALRKGQLLWGPAGSPPEDLKLAHELLLNLEKKNPGNGFFPFFRLYLEEKLGLPKEKLRETAKVLEGASSFDSGLTGIDREFREAFWQSPAMHFTLNWVYSTTSPAYYTPAGLLRRLSEENEFTGLRPFAELMMQDGLRAVRPHYTGEFDLQQYNTGRSLAPAGFPDWNELPAEKARPYQYAAAPQPWVTDEVTGERRCDPGPYETFFFEQRESR